MRGIAKVEAGVPPTRKVVGARHDRLRLERLKRRVRRTLGRYGGGHCNFQVQGDDRQQPAAAGLHFEAAAILAGNPSRNTQDKFRRSVQPPLATNRRRGQRVFAASALHFPAAYAQVRFLAVLKDYFVAVSFNHENAVGSGSYGEFHRAE